MASAPPESVTHLPTNLLGLAAMLAGVAAMLVWPIDVEAAAPLLMVLAALPILAGDVLVRKVHLRPSTGIDWSQQRPVSWERVSTKLVGLVGSAGMVLAAYGLFPEYQGEFYDSYYRFLWRFGPVAAVLAVPYFAWLDRKLVEPRDKYWHLGAWLTGRGLQVDRQEVGDLLRGWVIKGFFVPLMFVYMVNNLEELRGLVEVDRPGFLYWFDSLWSLGFLIDVTFTTMGYILSLRVTDTHIRSAEPTMLGWVAAIVCYQPFFTLFGGQYLAYDNGVYWGEVLEPFPVIKVAWGCALLLTLVVFSGSTVAFGCRFSNLTHRGIITTGFYRYTKHPAYWSKLISFFLIFVPFWYQGDWYGVVRDTVMLTLLGGVYYIRARTEEEHLSADPDYVRYALWMNDRGVFAFLGRWFPALRYRAPASYTE